MKKRTVSPWVGLTTRMIAFSAAGTALIFGATLLGFGGGAFYFNLGDAMIFMTSALLGPVAGAIAGGLGSFFADLAVYPTTMLFTLVIKALEGLVCGLFFLLIRKKDILPQAGKYALSVVGLVLPAAIMALGYFLCQSLFYGTKAAALTALPWDALQGGIGVVIAWIALYPCRLLRLRNKLFPPIVKPAEKTAPEPPTSTPEA